MNQIYTRAALSRREAEVLRLLGDGKTTPEIAAKLKVSLKTVQQNRRRAPKDYAVWEIHPVIPLFFLDVQSGNNPPPDVLGDHR